LQSYVYVSPATAELFSKCRVKHLEFFTQESVPKFVEHEPLKKLIYKNCNTAEK